MIDYLEYEKGHHRPIFRREAPCFAPTKDFTALTKLAYPCVVRGELTGKHTSFWVGFVRSFLDDLPWTSESISYCGQPSILYTLTGFHPVRQHNLLYTTAFRYPDEFPAVVRALHDERGGLSAEGLFRRFQDIHDMARYGEGPAADDVDAAWQGHSLIHPVGGSRPPVTLAAFKRNLARVIHGVQLHFADHDDNAAAEIKQPPVFMSDY